MRISIQVAGYYDWVPCPAGTTITEADVRALRVKQMSDGNWYMRVEQKSTAGQHHDVSIHEEAVCRRMAALALLGRPESRNRVIVELLQASLHHHLSDDHIAGITVEGDEPDSALLAGALADAGVLDAEAQKIVGRYPTVAVAAALAALGDVAGQVDGPPPPSTVEPFLRALYQVQS